jgi:catechol 2,3-dioxygenase-like lactoylglutathione lyase family enzyme
LIKGLSHITIWVLNQDEAYEFYTKKLGFEVRTDDKSQGFRWLTVGPKDQPRFEMVLLEAKEGFMLDKETVSKIRSLIENGKMGGGVFETDDCTSTYEELKGRGVEFKSAPNERPYGTEAVFKDNSGNWYSLVQRKK